MCERDNRKNIVNTVNGVVKKILGSGQWKPFKENEDKKGIIIHLHLYILNEEFKIDEQVTERKKSISSDVMSSTTDFNNMLLYRSNYCEKT